MKTILAFAGLTLALCPLAPAQDSTGQRVVVPARNSSRPRKVTAHQVRGPIIVKTHAGRDVIVESAGSEKARHPAPDGMRRIDIPRGLSVEEEDNQISVRTSMSSGGGVVITVPVDTALDLHTMNNEITVEGVKGEIVVDAMNGKVTLNNVGGNVLAHTLNGPIKVIMDTVDAAKPQSFITLNGTIDVTLPANYKGNVKVNTHNGAIYTDFEFRLGGGVITQPNNTSEGKFKVTLGDNGFTGTINGGGPEATFRTHNGSIYIRKKK